MTIDKFGRSLKTYDKDLVKGLKGEGFNLTEDGDYDIQNKRLCNVGKPTDAKDAATKDYVDSKSIPLSEAQYNLGFRRIWRLGDPKEPSEAVNLRTLNKLSMTISKNDKNNFDALGKQINNLTDPKNPDNAATKAYVDNTCATSITPITTNLAKQLTDITEINTRLAKCEGQIATNKAYHDKNLRKFGTLLFNYINRKQIGRTAILPTAGDEYLNWEDLFKLPSSPPPSPPPPPPPPPAQPASNSGVLPLDVHLPLEDEDNTEYYRDRRI